jgi:hypothetical protein
MSNQDLLVTLIGLGVIVVIAIVFLIYRIRKTGDKQEANDFLEGLYEELKLLVLKVIKSFSLDDLENIDKDTIAKIENAILKSIYDTCWNYVKNVVEKNVDDNKDFFTQAVLAFLENKEFVEEFIKKLINSESIGVVIHEKATLLLDNKAEKVLEESIEEDKELQEEFSDQEKYIEELKDEDQTRGEEVEEPTEEELSRLNPQVDEPEELDPENDPSVEVVEDEDNDIYYDKSGRARSKKTGKWVKLDK